MAGSRPLKYLRNNMSIYSLTCVGAVGNATGANFLLKTPDFKLLVDCGLVQGSHFAQEENREAFPYNPADIKYLLITHAHMDHIGRIPKLVREGFAGTIYSTPETKELAAIMLEDAYNLISREARESNRTSIYEKEDVYASLGLWKTIEYHTQFDLGSGINIYLKDAGHILGSAIIEVNVPAVGVSAAKKIVFTGDLGNSPTPLLPDTELVDQADYMVIESVYGDRNHEPKDERDEKLKRILKESLGQGGTVVIPAFSIERTQVILYQINNLVEANQLPKVPVFLDSPLALKVTDIYRRHIENFNTKTQAAIRSGDDIFDFPGLRVVQSADESAAIHSVKGPKIIIAGSGMSVGGRVLSHEKYFLSDPNATILLVGFQVPGSLGRKIEEKAPRVTVDHMDVKVRARIEKISGYSSHKDSNGLVYFVGNVGVEGASGLKKVFVAMGENKSSAFLAQRMRAELSVNAIVPEKNVEYPL